MTDWIESDDHREHVRKKISKCEDFLSVATASYVKDPRMQVHVDVANELDKSVIIATTWRVYYSDEFTEMFGQSKIEKIFADKDMMVAIKKAKAYVEGKYDEENEYIT